MESLVCPGIHSVWDDKVLVQAGKQWNVQAVLSHLPQP